ncbi:MAG: ABC transporter ATP-binding protein [Deltaproteobacteria bacterium]|nr:ABC transporter ATP-binding protein [Deltaproteobacteria bacterium]
MVDKSKALLEVQNIKVSYGAVQALKGVTLGVKEGEIVTLLGANGAGKSTLLKAIMQMVPLQEGDVLYLKESLTRTKTNQIVKKGIALVPEGRGILASMTVLENLELGAFHRSDWRSELDHIFELFPILKERIKQSAGTLSGGEQQMLAIGRALLSKPRLLLLDEPSLGLAPKIIQNIFQLIQRIRNEGISILLIEQNAHMALKVADRCYCLETGQVVISGSADELAHSEELKKAYLGG